MGLSEIERLLEEEEALLQAGEFESLRRVSSRLKGLMEKLGEIRGEDPSKLKAVLEKAKRCEELILQAIRDQRELLRRVREQKASLKGYVQGGQKGAFLFSKRC